jgi:hypothetical protein
LTSQEKSPTLSKKMQTTYPLRVQAIRTKGQQPRLYVSFPLALAAAIGLEAGESVQWELLDRANFTCFAQQSPTNNAPQSLLEVASERNDNGRFWVPTAKASVLTRPTRIENARCY